MASTLITKGVRKASLQLLRRHKSTVALSRISMHGFETPPTRVAVLDNGLRVATDNIGTATSSVGVWLDVGSRFETDDNNGVSNFLEHVAFKGTAKRSGVELEKEAEKRGVLFSADTSREMTSFTAQCRNEDLPWAIEILGEVAKNTTFEDSVVDRARADILKEMEEMESNYPAVVQDYLHGTAYQGTPLSRTILGPVENVKKMKADDLHAFANRLYRAPRMVLAYAGGANHQEVAELAQKHLGDVSATYQEEIPQPLPCRYTGSEIRDRDDAIPLAHVAIAVEGPGAASVDTIPLMVAAEIHGAWSRFHGGYINSPSKLRATFSNDGSIHSFEHFFKIYNDTSLWGIQLVSDRMELDRCIEFILNEWMRICTSASKFEVQRAKNALKTKVLMRLDGTSKPACEDIGRHMLQYDHHMKADELIHRINIVDSQSVREACINYVYDRCPAVASIGPVEAVPDYNRIRGNMWWMRF